MIIASTIVTFAVCITGLKDKIEAGITCLNNGQYEEAQDEFEAVLEKDPDNSQAKILNEIIIEFINATEEYKNNNLDKAKEYLDKIPNEYADYSIKDATDDLKKNVNILYQNKKLGLQMKFPRTWEGLYRIKETDTSIYVFTKQTVQHFEGEGFLFAITKWYDGIDEGVIDTISRNKSQFEYDLA